MGIRGKEIVERIDQRQSVLGVTRKDVALSAGLKSAQSITDWSNGSIPQADTALYIADKLGGSVRWLLTGEEDRGYTPDERNLVSKYRRLTEQGQYEVKVLIEAKLNVIQADEDEKKEA
jgi:transcriptional regulator with XRE-family HTH domain